MYIIETNSLTKKYGNKTIVDEISLTIKSGEIFGFLGTNGAGKTTFINMVTGIILPSSGNFKLLGAGKDDLEKIKNKIGVLPDYSSFYDDMTPVQHLDYFSRILGKKKSKSDILSLLQRVGLIDSADIKTKKFSFGMKKKLGIAQALINDPELIFLDEPTSGVDAESILDIHKLILDINNEGKTIFMTSHNLDEVEKICTTIGIMRQGSIHSMGSMEQLRKEHQKSYKVSIKHSPMKENAKQLIKTLIDGIAISAKYDKEYLYLTLEQENTIPIIIRALTQSKVDILRVEVEEPSLQEIFLSKESSDKLII
ncbi:ATP-binding cassette domain-containing protein [Metabacillus idriensis]|uniref:ABC transporter ATP-binding protein n=1 Tax=Metabacillus idriensis TaxID=324768 RepID=UPI001749337B|nr:ABC transporter ATP-binding protein [Metabacillus idriensis]